MYQLILRFFRRVLEIILKTKRAYIILSSINRRAKNDLDWKTNISQKDKQS